MGFFGRVWSRRNPFNSLKLAFLPPSVIKAAVESQKGPDLTSEQLRNQQNPSAHTKNAYNWGIMYHLKDK